MNEAIVCKPSPVKALSISAAPLRELLNFLIYGRHAELLTDPEILHALHGELSWTHYGLLLKVESGAAREFYETVSVS